jgi:hypothetical protein
LPFLVLIKNILNKMNRRRISLQEVVAEDATKEAKMLVVKYGEQPARNMDDLIEKLHYITAVHKKTALIDLAKIHPDRDLILSLCATPETKKENKSNACGCSSGFDGLLETELTSSCCGSCSCKSEKKSNATGSETKDSLKEYLPIAIVGAMFLVGLHIIYKNS